MDAADHLGVHATPLDHRGVATLRAAEHPLLLHMMSDGQMESFNHWNCFFGFRDGQVLLMDGDGAIVPTDLTDVLMRWDGSGLAISPSGIGVHTFFAETLFGGLLILCIFAGSVVLVGKVGRMRTSLQAGCTTAFLLMACLLIYGPSSIRPSDGSIGYVEHLKRAKAFPTILLEKAVVSSESVQLIDCRYQRDFDAGTIPGAISLPVDSSPSHLRNVLSRFGPKDSLVFSCQSSACSFDEIVAARATSSGFRAVQVASGGYHEYKNR